MRARTALIGVVAVTVVGAALVSGDASGIASADVTTVPWSQRPVTVGSGFRLGDGDARAEFVSQSGRYVVFRSSASNLGGTTTPGDPEALYVRDRWTDTTTVVPRTFGTAQRPLAMSPDGDLIAGVTDLSSTPELGWIYRQSTGRLVTLGPEYSVRFGGTLIEAINNDGYFFMRADIDGSSTSVVGRLLPDGSITAPTPAATPGGAPHNQATFWDLTPSMEYGVALSFNRLARVDMRTGATVWLDDATVLPADYAELRGIRGYLFTPAWISANGRYVAISSGFDQPLDVPRRVLVWDVEAGTLIDASPATAFRPEVLEVLDDGRVIYATPLRFPDELDYDNYDAWLTGPRASDPVIRLNQTADGQRIPLLGRGGWGHPTYVAGDIDRVLLCGFVPYSTFDTNGHTDCYLKPF